MKNNQSQIKVYVSVFVALLLLLMLTVIAAEFDLGSWNFTIAAAIAIMKVLLISLFFMHVRESPSLTRIVVVAGLLWLGILFCLTLTDYGTRDWLHVIRS